jgi:DHA2 family multidrug resistance protein-like MFS transporter
MASSLGVALGVAISAAIFTALSGESESIKWMDGLLTFVGRQDNIAIRQGAMIALGVNLIMVVLAIISIVVTVPKHTKETLPK